MVDLTSILEALIALAASAITVFLIPWMKSKMTNEQLEKARAFAQIGVFSADKLFGAGRGEEKFAYVEEFLKAKKIKLDTKTLKAVIEAEVMKLHLVDPNKAFDVLDAMIVDDPEEEEEEDQPEVVKDGL